MISAVTRSNRLAGRPRRQPLVAVAALLIALSAAPPASGGELPTAPPEAVGMSREALNEIEDMLADRIAAGELAGAVTGVARRGKVVYMKTHGQMDIESKTPMRADAIFRMASSSKPVTAVAILMLRDEGKLGLDDPVHRFIPEFKGAQVAVRSGTSVAEAGADVQTPAVGAGTAPAAELELVPAERDITIRDLLTHTSGLASGGDGVRAKPLPGRQDSDTLATYIPRLAAIPLDFQPGTRWAYSPRAGMDTLGRIVEVASGKPFDVFLRERIFEPLDMRDTFFVVPEEKQDRLVTLYRAVGGKLSRMESGGFARGGYFSGAGGLYSTARDYLRFEQMLAGKGALGAVRILKPQTVAEMASNQVGEKFRGIRGSDSRGVGFGLGVALTLDGSVASGSRSSGAFGWGGAFGTVTWTDPAEELTVVYMVQQPNFAILGEFERLVMEAISE